MQDRDAWRRWSPIPNQLDNRELEDEEKEEGYFYAPNGTIKVKTELYKYITFTLDH